MITKDNLKNALKSLKFEENKGIYSKKFKSHGTTLAADFNKGILIYPEEKGLVVNERQTCNFSSNENFVVFECVHRLLEKGYKAEHIELEPKWKIGHGAKGGRADILIKDNSGKALLIIECKTEGKEFTDAWRIMLNQATQLFSYAQQIRSTQFICLYASDYIDSNLVYKNYIVTLKDNEKLLAELADKDLLSYKNALEVEDIFKVWKDTYSQDAATKGIFEEEIQPYNIGKIKFNLEDLNTVSSKDIQGKYHEFATILRQHNVSGRENAFDKLVNLFLCKVVDENEHSNDLQFYWKGIAYDNYFDLIDRLQRLYKIGMDKFLEEEVTYVDEKSIDDAFRYFKNDKDATKDTIKNYFRQLKFFTNSDFAFIDVHNENLFYQNSAVLLKIVKMLQDIRLKTSEQNQFLGDMFEGFLDQGIKQSEGQFFTPMPIVKFILSCLPLEQLIAGTEIPKVIDYACGAGHFLNEYATQIKPIVDQQKKVPVTEYYPEIIGIEKEYRLSKVAKVSAFMYGQDDINIIYSDALADSSIIKDGSFSVLVANPPYSVKGFLEMLKPSELKRYELINTVEDKSYPNNNSIETFFIERAKQLLKPGGIAAIIVPSSIISKGNQKNTSKKQNIYVATRELLLKYFDIVAIAEFGKGTFGKTGTNTVTLFLRRRTENPSVAEQYKIRIETWFNGDTSKDGIFADEHFIKLYCDHIEVDFNEYLSLIQGNPSPELMKAPVFSLYQKEFEKSTEIVKKRKQRTFKALNISQQNAEIASSLLIYIHRIEKDKLYYFVMASQNPQEVIILKSPTDNAAEKKFLGYEWSAAKGKEGIKYMGTAQIKIESEIEEKEEEGIVLLEEDDKRVLGNILNLSNIQTPLYDPKNRNNEEKINFLIQRNFNGSPVNIPESLKEFVHKARLVDMLDFKRKEFNKAISLNPRLKSSGINTKWELVIMGDYVDVKIGGTPSRSNYNYFGGENLWVSISEMNGQIIAHTKETITNEGIANSNVKLIPKGTTLISFKLSIGKTAIAGKDLYTNEAIAGLVPKDQSVILNGYLYHMFNAKQIDLEKDGFNTFGKSLNSEFLKTEVRIPKPPKVVQEKIIKACEMIDSATRKGLAQIEKLKKEIDTIIDSAISSATHTKALSDTSVATINPSKREIATINEETMVSFVEMASVSENGFINRMENRQLKDLSKGSYTYFKDEDIIMAKITPCMENGKCAIAKKLTNGIGLGSSEFHVIRATGNISNEFIFMILNREVVRKEAEKNMTGSSGHRRVPVSFYESYMIPVLNPAEQTAFLKKIEALKIKINSLYSQIDESGERKKQVIKQYL